MHKTILALFLVVIVVCINVQSSMQENTGKRPMPRKATDTDDFTLERTLSEFFGGNGNPNHRSTRSKRRGYILSDKGFKHFNRRDKSLIRKRSYFKMNDKEKNDEYAHNTLLRKRSTYALSDVEKPGDHAHNTFTRKRRRSYALDDSQKKNEYAYKTLLRKRSYVLEDVLADSNREIVHNSVRGKRSYAMNDESKLIDVGHVVRKKRHPIRIASERRFKPRPRIRKIPHAFRSFYGKRRSIRYRKKDDDEISSKTGHIGRVRKRRMFRSNSDEHQPSLADCLAKCRKYFICVNYGQAKKCTQPKNCFCDIESYGIMDEAISEIMAKSQKATLDLSKQKRQSKKQVEKIEDDSHCSSSRCGSYYVCRAEEKHYGYRLNCVKPNGCLCINPLEDQLVSDKYFSFKKPHKHTHRRKRRSLNTKNIMQSSSCHDECNYYYNCLFRQTLDASISCLKPLCDCSQLLSDDEISSKQEGIRHKSKYFSMLKAMFAKHHAEPEKYSTSSKCVNTCSKYHMCRMKYEEAECADVTNDCKCYRFNWESNSEDMKSIARNVPVIEEPKDPIQSVDNEEEKESCLKQCARYYGCVIKNFSTTKCKEPNACKCNFWS